MTSDAQLAEPASTRLSQLARLLPDRVQAHHGPGPRVAALRQALGAFGEDSRRVDRDSLAEVEAATKSVFGHLDLSLASGLAPQQLSAGWGPDDLAGTRRSGASIAAVIRDRGGVAVLRLDGLADATAAAPLLAAAFGLAAGASAVVLDLRRNGGGDPATLALVVDWLAGGEPRHLFDVEYAASDVRSGVGRTRQWWTAGAPVATPPGVPVAAVIGPGTYSSGEALAWVLQREGLAVLVGERTPGAADHVLPLALTHDVHALVPEATVLAVDGEPTWESTGVRPDHVLSLSADEPLDLDLIAELARRRRGDAPPAG